MPYTKENSLVDAIHKLLRDKIYLDLQLNVVHESVSLYGCFLISGNDWIAGCSKINSIREI